MINEPMYTDAKEICNEVLELFTNGEIGEIYLLIHPLRTPLSTNQNSLSCFRLNRSSKKRAVQKARH